MDGLHLLDALRHALNGEVDHHDAVFLHDAEEANIPTKA